MERHIAQILKEQHGEAQISKGHHGSAQSRVERDRYNGAASDLNRARSERSSTDLGRAATGITDQDGVVCNDVDSVHRLSKVDVSLVCIVGLDL